MEKIVILDWSLLGYKQWFRMKSPNYKAYTELELGDFAINMALEAYRYRIRFEPTTYIFALDRTPWRIKAYDQYYEIFVQYWKSLSDSRSWVVAFDQKYYECKYHGGRKTWIYTKFGKDGRDKFKVESQDPKLWLYFDKGRTPKEVIETFPDCPKSVQETEDWEGLQHIIPKYKGNRKAQKWDFTTPKEEFKDHLETLAHNLAPVVGGRPIAAESAEADDIAAFVVKENPNAEIILVSADQDWQQLLIDRPFVSVWDPYVNNWIPNNTDHIKLKLLCKILGGDTSDNIAGVSIEDRAPLSPVEWETNGESVKGGKNTFKFANKILDETRGNFAELHGLLMHTQTEKTYYRNLILVSFKSVPDYIQAAINMALKNTPTTEPKYNLTDFLVDIKKQRAEEKEVSHIAEIDKTARQVTPSGIIYPLADRPNPYANQ